MSNNRFCEKVIKGYNFSSIENPKSNTAVQAEWKFYFR